jgi:protease IV
LGIRGHQVDTWWLTALVRATHFWRLIMSIRSFFAGLFLGRETELDKWSNREGPGSDSVMVAMVKDLLSDRKAERRNRLVRAGLYFLIFVVPGAVSMGMLAYSAGYRMGPSEGAVGVIHIDGPIAADAMASADRVVPAMEKAFESEHVKAIVLSIDSPGGAPVEAERIYRSLAVLRAQHPKKQVVTVINNIGASAAYMIALHTDKIYAGQYSLVGSVGAVLSGWDFHKALDRVDVAQRVYASGNLKAMLNPYLPMSDAANQKAQSLVSQMGAQFHRELVQQRGAKLIRGKDYGTGEIWGGEEARQVGLVDEIGTLDEVIKTKWKVDAYDYGPRASNVPLMGAAADWMRGLVMKTAQPAMALQ